MKERVAEAGLGEPVRDLHAAAAQTVGVVAATEDTNEDEPALGELYVGVGENVGGGVGHDVVSVILPGGVLERMSTVPGKIRARTSDVVSGGRKRGGMAGTYLRTTILAPKRKVSTSSERTASMTPIRLR